MVSANLKWEAELINNSETGPTAEIFRRFSNLRFDLSGHESLWLKMYQHLVRLEYLGRSLKYTILPC
jgi:hypothetical protein